MREKAKIMCSLICCAVMLLSSAFTSPDISSRAGTLAVETGEGFAYSENDLDLPSLEIESPSLEELLTQGYDGTANIPPTEISLEEYISSFQGNDSSEDSSTLAATNGWVAVGSKWQYYVNGSPITGWKQISGKWYYFGSDTYMVTGWKKFSGSWYYFNTDGDMVTGIVNIGNETYYFTDTGAMYQGFYPSVSAPSYYYGYPGQADAGARYKGWLNIGNDWYYANRTTGILAIGDCELDYKRFYFDPTSRKMGHGYITVNGQNRFYDDTSTSDNYGVLWEAVYDVVTTLTSGNSAEANQNIYYLGQMGYTTSKNNYPLPTDTFVDLPTRKVSVVHGHGERTSTLQYILFEDPPEKYEDKVTYPGYLYGRVGQLVNADAQISDYDENELNFVDLAIYTSCYSAYPNNNSVAQWTYTKGARTVLGYARVVNSGEYFSAYLLDSMGAGNSLKVALEDSVVLFDLIFPGLLSNPDRASNPGNYKIYGDINLTIGV